MNPRELDAVVVQVLDDLTSGAERLFGFLWRRMTLAQEYRGQVTGSHALVVSSLVEPGPKCRDGNAHDGRSQSHDQ